MFRFVPVLRVLAALLIVAALSACTADHKWASDADVARAHYADPNPPSITLFTSINTRNQTGAHAGLLINADERVLFDPAGEFGNDVQPAPAEREDLIYGMTPGMLVAYVNYQGNAPFQVVEQTIYVTPEVAARVKAAAIAQGAANKAACTIAISEVLAGVPGFEGLFVGLDKGLLLRRCGGSGGREGEREGHDNEREEAFHRCAVVEEKETGRAITPRRGT